MSPLQPLIQKRWRRWPWPSVGILQVLVEVVLVEGDVAVAHAVQDGPGALVSQDGGVALDEGYDLEGIRGPKIDKYLTEMKDASQTPMQAASSAPSIFWTVFSSKNRAPAK